MSPHRPTGLHSQERPVQRPGPSDLSQDDPGGRAAPPPLTHRGPMRHFLPTHAFADTHCAGPRPGAQPHRPPLGLALPTRLPPVHSLCALSSPAAPRRPPGGLGDGSTCGSPCLAPTRSDCPQSSSGLKPTLLTVQRVPPTMPGPSLLPSRPPAGEPPVSPGHTPPDRVPQPPDGPPTRPGRPRGTHPFGLAFWTFQPPAAGGGLEARRWTGCSQSATGRRGNQQGPPQRQGSPGGTCRELHSTATRQNESSWLPVSRGRMRIAPVKSPRRGCFQTNRKANADKHL